MIIAVDFDGTIVNHEFPNVGSPNPRAFYWMKRWQGAGAKLILWTMRSANRSDNSDPLGEAVRHCNSAGVVFWGVNSNPRATHLDRISEGIRPPIRR